jgi:hypothetical protein
MYIFISIAIIQDNAINNNNDWWYIILFQQFFYRYLLLISDWLLNWWQYDHTVGGIVALERNVITL